jgi:hypothetical protein
MSILVRVTCDSTNTDFELRSVRGHILSYNHIPGKRVYYKCNACPGSHPLPWNALVFEAGMAGFPEMFLGDPSADVARDYELATGWHVPTSREPNAWDDLLVGEFADGLDGLLERMLKED